MLSKGWIRTWSGVLQFYNDFLCTGTTAASLIIIVGAQQAVMDWTDVCDDGPSQCILIWEFNLTIPRSQHPADFAQLLNLAPLSQKQ